MTSDSAPLAPSDILAIDSRASVLMKRGIHLLNDPQGHSIADALQCFDSALELRRRLPIETAPALRYGLAACWLNRADALMRLGDTAQLALALLAHDEALVLLRTLPLDDDARFVRRLAIAHQNRGLALQAQGRVADAIADFMDAIAVLDHDRAQAIADRTYLLAAVCMNLANARASEATPESDPRAHDAACRAIALVKELEANDPDAADVGLWARHVLCRIAARQLSREGAPDGTMSDEVHQATDLVDDGLALVRQFERRGIARFRRVAQDLFRFGLRVYAAHQPHFVEEFVRENSDPERSSAAFVESAEMRSGIDEGRRLLR